MQEEDSDMETHKKTGGEAGARKTSFRLARVRKKKSDHLYYVHTSNLAGQTVPGLEQLKSSHHTLYIKNDVRSNMTYYTSLRAIL
jgi:hypothetical protein